MTIYNNTGRHTQTHTQGGKVKYFCISHGFYIVTHNGY